MARPARRFRHRTARVPQMSSFLLACLAIVPCSQIRAANHPPRCWPAPGLPVRLRGEAGRVQTAFVLGGGGILGAHEVGMLRALSEAGIRPDVVVGTSVGAINGALVAADPPAAPAPLARLLPGDVPREAVRDTAWRPPP